jgi:hypothetical protein
MTIGINCLVLLCDLQLNCVQSRTKEKLLSKRKTSPHLRFAAIDLSEAKMMKKSLEVDWEKNVE